MEAFRFEHPEYLYLLFLVPLVVLYFVVIQIQRKKAIQRIASEELIDVLMPDRSVNRPVWKFVLISIAFAVSILMIAGPQFGAKLQKVKRKGVEIIIALDVSNSMMARDIKPNRLESSKRAISKMVDKLHNDKIGMIVFAGDAYTQLPITTDYASAKMFLSTINTDIVPVQGTAIGKAIKLATKSFGPESGAGRAIVVITDGENHEDDAVEAAKAALDKGVIVHTIGMGLPQGAPIPSGGSNTFLKDREGNVVMTKLNGKMLEEIAVAGGGYYTRANNSATGLNKLFEKISEMDKADFDSKVYSDYNDQFYWLAWIVFVILLVELLILERKNKYLKNINLFK